MFSGQEVSRPEVSPAEPQFIPGYPVNPATRCSAGFASHKADDIDPATVAFRMNGVRFFYSQASLPAIVMDFAPRDDHAIPPAVVRSSSFPLILHEDHGPDTVDLVIGIDSTRGERRNIGPEH